MSEDDNDAAWAYLEELERRFREEEAIQRGREKLQQFRQEQAANARSRGDEHEAKWWDRHAV